MSNDTIVDSKQAVSVFLESLLKETELDEPVVVQVQEAPVVSLVEPVAKVDIVEAEPVTVEVETTAELTVAPEAVADEVKNETQQSELPFQALIFKVAGLKLAVRLVELNGVLEWDDSKMTEMPGHSDFYMGIREYLGKSIPIIDTARLVFPAEKLVALSADKPTERVTRIVLIDDGKWGLACDEIDEVIDLSYDEVKWRANRSQRKWMAGTVIQHMCALVDGDGFSEMLEDGSHNRR